MKVLVGVCLLAPFLIHAQEGGRTRVVQKVSHRNEPVEIVELRTDGQAVKFLQGFPGRKDWLNKLTLKVRNNSGKPITYVAVTLEIDQAGAMDYPLHVPLVYGRRAASSGEASPPATPEAVAPGAACQLSMSEQVGEFLTQFLEEKGVAEVNSAKLIIDLVLFGDGTAWKNGLTMDPDPSKPGNWKVRGRGEAGAGPPAGTSPGAGSTAAGRSRSPRLGPAAGCGRAGAPPAWPGGFSFLSANFLVGGAALAPTSLYDDVFLSPCIYFSETDYKQCSLDNCGVAYCVALMDRGTRNRPDPLAQPGRMKSVTAVCTGQGAPCNICPVSSTTVKRWEPIVSSACSYSPCTNSPYCPREEQTYNWETCFCLNSPVLIDVAGNGFDLTGLQGGVAFDIDGDGDGEDVSWTAAASDDAWLAIDRNGNGRVDGGQELFGDSTPQDAAPEPNGFLALARFDRPDNGGNGDRVIDGRDAVFTSLWLWRDANHNGVSEPGELHSLTSKGVARLDLDFKESRRTDRHGNEFRYRAKVYGSGGQHLGRWAYDVYLLTRQ
jgi:hypothetical protein